MEKQMEALLIVRGIILEAIESLDNGKKVDGLEYAIEVIDQVQK